MPYEPQKILDLVNQKDDLQVVIRGHLLAEHYLVELIENNLPIKNQLDFDSIRFPQLVRLARSLDCIDADFKGMLLKINKLRNKYAHNLEWEVTQKEIDEILSTLPKEDKGELENESAYKNGNLTKRLGGVFLYVLAFFQVLLNET